MTAMIASSRTLIPDYLEQPCPNPAIRWSRVNAGEQYPGQVSPLSWSLQLSQGDISLRAVFGRMGLLGRSEAIWSGDIESSFIALRHGRLCANVDMLRDAMDRLPGDAGDALEEQLLGAKPTSPQKRARKRPWSIAMRMPIALWVSVRHSRPAADATKAWWRGWVARIEAEGAVAARQALPENMPRQLKDATVFGVAAFCQQAVHGILSGLLPEAVRGRLLELPSGQVFPETQFAIAIWTYAQGAIPREAVIEQFGYFGGEGGDCASDSIRASPEMLEDLSAIYADAPSPEIKVTRTRARRAALIAEMLDATPPSRRGLVRILLRLADRLALARELGRSAWLQAMDVGRCAAMAIGRDLVASGHLRSAGHAAYLTTDELLNGDPATFDATTAYRRALFEWRNTFSLPNGFSGEPERLSLQAHEVAEGPDDADGGGVSGMPAAAGVARGIARVILSPFASRGFAKGDILVCRYTDPSWSPIISLAGGIVADIGGALSHGAIIARELGVPAIVNTRFGTRRIPDGALIEINGATGEIRVIEDDVSGSPAACVRG